MYVKILCALAFAFSFALTATASEITGSAVVIDGDTLQVGDTRVRLFGIDAPEADQTCRTEQGAVWACGAWVSAQTRALVQYRDVTCLRVDTDRYGRVVARCYLGDVDLAERLVSEGLAFAYRRYSMAYDLTEKRAAIQDRGLHAMRIQSPAQFRQNRAAGRIPQDRTCAIKGNISSKGVRIYHMPGQRDYERTGIREARGERWFCSEAQAQAAGWRRARR